MMRQKIKKFNLACKTLSWTCNILLTWTCWSVEGAYYCNLQIYVHTGKNCTLVLSMARGRTYSRPWTQFSQHRSTKAVFFATVHLWKQLLCWILFKAVQYKFGVCPCLTFWAQKYGFNKLIASLCLECLHFTLFYGVTKSLKSCLSCTLRSCLHLGFGWKNQDC